MNHGDSCYGRGDFGLVTSRMLSIVCCLSSVVYLLLSTVYCYYVNTCHNCKIKMNCKLAFKCIIYCKSSLLYAEKETYSLHLKSLHVAMYRPVT